MSVVIRIFSWYTLVAYHSRISRAGTCMLVLCWYLGDGLTCPLFCSVCAPRAPFPTAVPRVVAVSPQMRLVEDNPSSLSLVEIYKQRCAKKGIEHDNPISRYYDRLATVQARGTQASHQVGACIGSFVPDPTMASPPPALALRLSFGARHVFCRRGILGFLCGFGFAQCFLGNSYISLVF